MANLVSFIVNNCVIYDTELLTFQGDHQMYHYKLRHPDISESMDIYLDAEKYAVESKRPVEGESVRVLVQSTAVWKDNVRTEGNRLRFRFKDF